VAVIGTRLRVAALRLGFRAVFGLPRSVKRLLAGPQVRVEDQGLDLDVQLLYRIGSLLSRREGGALDQATLSEQRRQADLAADISGDQVFDEIHTRDLEVDGAAGPRPARLYEPEAAGTPGPLLVFFHGGGFALGSLTTADPLCRLIAAQAQLRVLSVSYRLAPEHPYPAGLDDALAAFAWVRSHADEIGAVCGLLALGGDSAGANLALVTAHQHPGEAAFVLALYPVTDVARTGGSRSTFGSGYGIGIVFTAIVAAIFGGLLGEEIGWRGYALPRLTDRLGKAGASVLLGLVWAGWHLPVFFIPGMDQSGQSLPVYILQVTALSVAMAWLYWHTRGSLLLAVLMHTAINQTKDIVPSRVVDGAGNPWGLSHSPVAWLTVLLLGLNAVYFLARMANDERQARVSSIVQ